VKYDIERLMCLFCALGSAEKLYNPLPHSPTDCEMTVTKCYRLIVSHSEPGRIASIAFPWSLKYSGEMFFGLAGSACGQSGGRRGGPYLMANCK